jgi:hypothetical protein
MKFYKNQHGPVGSEVLYAEALREILLLPPNGSCALEYPDDAPDQAAVMAAEIQMRARLLKLSPEELRKTVYIASTLESVGAEQAEKWFVDRLTGIEARDDLKRLAASCKHCREELEQIVDPNPYTPREFGTKLVGQGHTPDRQGPHDKSFSDLIAKMKAGKLSLSR